MRFNTIVAVILALAVCPVSAEVYKWKTNSGETEYGQFPPSGVQAERMTSSGLKAVPQPEMEDDEVAPADSGDGAPAAESAEPAKPATPEQSLQMLKEQQAEQASAAAEQADAARQDAQRKRSCADARSNLAVLQQGGHRRMRLPDGTVTHLTAEETEQRIAEAKQQIEQSCD